MKLISFLTLTILICSCSSHKIEKIDFKNMFESAMKNQSTSPDYIVIKLIDLNTNEEKEICCESTDLDYALTLDSMSTNLKNIQYDKTGIPIFKFNTANALKHLRFYTYNKEVVDSIYKTSSNELIDSIKKEFEETGYSKLLEQHTAKFSENYFEHYLYLNGILSHRDCESGFTVLNEK